MKKYYWTGISTEERNSAISDISAIVSGYATIVNFQRFSDISLNLVLQLEECNLKDMLIGLRHSMSVDCKDISFTDSKSECIGLLTITFTKSTGDFEIETPNIPE